MSRVLALFLIVLGFVSPTEAAPRPATESFSVPIVQLGSFGPDVFAVQLRLHQFGYTVVLDSVYGPQTYRAVTHFQRANGLVADGVVGPATQRAMGIVLGWHPVVSVSRTVTSPAVVANVERWHQAALQAGWSESQWPKLACVINRESRGNPLSRTGHYFGLLQINNGALGYIQQAGGSSVWDLFDGPMNLRVGYRMYLARGWSPWSSTTGGC
jgi:hypothetical protein